ncbi:MAG: hypothetical protein V2A73_07985 [Pseudomonadota bacterium]
MKTRQSPPNPRRKARAPGAAIPAGAGAAAAGSCEPGAVGSVRTIGSAGFARAAHFARTAAHAAHFACATARAAAAIRTTTLGAVLFALILISLAAPHVQGGSLGEDTMQVFEVLRQASIDEIYDQWGTWIDFTLFLFLFIPLTQLALGRHFVGRSGKILAVAVGLILSLGLAVMERTMHFNLRSFGPVAALLAMAAVGMLIFLTLKHLGVHAVTAAALSYILMYFSLQAVGPGLYDWIYDRAPWVSIILILCMAIAIVKGVRSIWPSIRARTQLPTAVAAKGRTEEGLREEEKGVKALRKLTKTEHRDTKKMIRDLERAKTMIKTGKAKQEVCEMLHALEFQDDEILRHVYELKQLTERLRSLDLAAYHQLRDQYQGTALKEQRDHLRKEIHDEMDKVQAEQTIEQFEKLLEDRSMHARNYLKLVANYVDSNDPGGAVTLVDKAISCMKDIQTGTERVRKLEKHLCRLLNHERDIAHDETRLEKKAA